MKKIYKRAVAFLVAFACLFSMVALSFPEAQAAADYEKDIFNFMKINMGMNDAAACGILANIRRESNFNPNLVGDGGDSYGICQWHEVRFENLKSFCKEKGYDYKSITGQLYFLKHELETLFPNTLAHIKSVENTAEGAYEAGYSFCYNFERPANKEAKSVQRGELAQEYWATYGIIGSTVAQVLRNVSDGNVAYSKNDITVTWKAGSGNYNRNRLHIVERTPGTVSYDWDNEKVYITSLNTLEYTFPKGTLPEGNYLIWVEPWHTTQQRAGEGSNRILLTVYDELFYEVETDVEGVTYDAKKAESVDIGGWAVNTGGHSVEFYLSLDGEKAELADSKSRKDISDKYADFCKDTYAGFTKSYSMSDLSNGEHTITVVAKSESVTQTLAEMTFTVTNGHDHSFTRFVSNNDATYISDGTKTAKCDLCNTKRTVPDSSTKLLLGVTSEVSANARDTMVTLSWSKVKDAAGYRVYIYNSGWKAIDTTTATSYTVKGLDVCRSYRFAVKAYGTEDSKTFWAPEYATAEALTTPSVISSVSLSSASDSVTVRWEKAKGATGYRVFVFNTETRKWDIAVRSTQSVSATVKNLKPGTSYLIAVRPYRNTGTEIIWAYDYTSASVYTKLEAPALKAHSSATGRATVGWSKVEGATGYQVWYSFTEKGTYVKLGNFSGTSTYHSSLESGETCYYKVRAYKKVGTGYIYSDYTPVTAVKIK